MGWWWSSSSPQKDGPSSSPQTPSQTPQPSQAPSPPPRTLSREEQADLEFKALIASLEGDINRANAPKNTDPQQQQQQAPGTTPPQPTEPSIAPDSLYQDTMSCRAAFDYAFFCQSFGGQFVNVYRYGELRSCSEHWDNFWLCMKTRTYPDESKRKAIREHNRKKAIKYKTGPSSEDIWDLRNRPVENAFQGDFAALEREMEAEEAAARQG